MRHPYLSAAAALLAAGGWLASCGTGDQQATTKQPADAATEQADGTSPEQLALASRGNIRPLPMPSPGIPGYSFPQDSSTIMGWVQRADSLAINRHGWGVWTALSSPTPYVYQGDSLRVFDTWLTESEVNTALQRSAQKMEAEPPRPGGLLQRPLRVPRQFLEQSVRSNRLEKTSPSAMLLAAPNGSKQSVFESVSYDPTAARTIIQGKLFWNSRLQRMLNVGQAAIPDFPAAAVAIKPVYEVVPGPKRRQGLYQMKVWSGPPATPQAYDQDKWPSCVYVDVLGRGQGRGLTSIGCRPAQPATTYNLNDFIHYTITAADVAALPGSQVGDYAILVAMHISTKEIKQWTWQTVWWAPDPNRVPAPSSRSVAASRPSQLRGAPRHYAMAIAYQMLAPTQPYVGGNNRGKSIYVFNPYLEARFSGFSDTARVLTNGQLVVNNVGVRTNCMSCHAQAAFTPLNSKTVQPTSYIGSTYVPMNKPVFRGNLRTDFLWTVASLGDDSTNAKR